MRVCPLCGDEFLDRVLTCPDCEIGLITEAESASFSEPLEAVSILTGDRASLTSFATMLRKYQIPSKIEACKVSVRLPTPVPFLKIPVGDIPGSKLCLYVGSQHLAEVQDVIRRLEAQEATEAAFALHGTQECPRCGAVLVEDAEECSFCSLPLRGRDGE